MDWNDEFPVRAKLLVMGCRQPGTSGTGFIIKRAVQMTGVRRQGCLPARQDLTMPHGKQYGGIEGVLNGIISYHLKETVH